jgi:hypothetical protein
MARRQVPQTGYNTPYRTSWGFSRQNNASETNASDCGLCGCTVRTTVRVLVRLNVHSLCVEYTLRMVTQ